MNYKNGFFQLAHKDGELFLKLFPGINGGKPIQNDDILWYLDKVKVTDYNKGAVGREAANAREKKEIRIYPGDIPAVNEIVRITVTDDRMKAIARFYPPSSKGRLLTKEEILEQLKIEHINYGIIEKNIDLYLKGRQFCTNLLVAKGLPIEEGKSAQIVYHFKTDGIAKPKINEDGSVDFHDLGNINHVKKGDVLAEKIPMNLGKPGKDVTGAEIRQNKVKDAILKHGKNITVSSDGLQMTSDVDGHVSLANDTVFVSNTYEVPADVGPSTGDIEYDGNVTVKGNVLTGFSVKAQGDIVVNGVVEGAYLEAGGNIILRNGIQGMKRGVLKAKGEIVTKFIENATVETESTIKTDAIMHSKVVARGDILATGKRGLIIGGEVRSGSNISLKTAGSTMGTSTVLEVGIDPAFIERCRMYERKKTELVNEMEKTSQIINLLGKKLAAGEKMAPDKLKILQAASAKHKEQQASLEELSQKVMEAKEEIDQHSGGKVSVENMAFPGTQLIISNVTYFVKTAFHYCQFIREGAEVVSKPF